MNCVIEIESFTKGISHRIFYKTFSNFFASILMILIDQKLIDIILETMNIRKKLSNL